MQLEKDVMLLNLGKVLSSDCQDQHPASPGGCVGNTYGASTGLLGTQAVYSGATWQTQKCSPSRNRAGRRFQHLE